MTITAKDVSTRADDRVGQRVYECHDTERGYKCNVRLYEWGLNCAKRAVEIAQGHFDAKARAEGKALV